MAPGYGRPVELLDRLQPPARRRQPSLSLAARAGLVAHGVLYVTIGLLALEVARGGGREQADGRGAIEALAEQPFGWALLLLLAVGLAALALWKAAQALRGDPVAGDEPADRALYAGKAVLYASLAASAAAALGGGSSGGSGDQQARSWTARAMELPGGRLLVALVGLGVVGYALHALWERAVHARFMEQLDRSALRARAAGTIRRLGQIGYAARSTVLVLVGAFLVRAAWEFDPDEAKGLSESLHELAASGWRPVLWFVALGLVAFGLLSVVLARYRRI